MIKVASWLMPFVSLLATHPALAVPKRPNALVIVVEGDVAAEQEIADAILPTLPTQPPDDLVAALANYGIQGSPSRALVTPQTRQQALLAFRKAMKQVGAAAVLTVQIKRSKTGGREMHVILLLSTQTEPMIEEDITVPRGDKATPWLAPLLSVSLQDLVPPPPDASEAANAAATPVSVGSPARSARKSDNRPSGENADRRARKKVPAEKTEVTENEASAALPEKDSGSKSKKSVFIRMP